MFIRKVRAVLPQIIAFGPKMIIYHIHHHSDPALMRRIHQPPESLYAAVRVLDGEGENTVVTPVTRAGELRQWHQLDRIDTQPGEIIEPGGYPVEVMRRRKGSHMQFIADHARKCDPRPALILPAVCAEVNNCRGAMHAFRL